VAAFARKPLSLSLFGADFHPGRLTWKPINHPFREENDLPNLYDYVPC